MAKTTYKTEREGQIDFFENYGIPYDDGTVLIDNTDGVYNGNLYEFKLAISNLNSVLFQAIKYLSKMRIRGQSVPATILLISLNTTEVYVYRSEDYFDDIHKVYIGASSKNNSGFIAKEYEEKLDYSDMTGSDRVRKLLKGKKSLSEMYMPVDIDENCIVGWAERYYSEKPKASKGDFLGDETGKQVKIIGEIRDPKHFAGLINPYKGQTNEKFKYLMDCLNDRLSKKDLGAFYTPEPYCRKASELVQMAVDRIPEGNDYIILDRCAGTGNLESALIGLTDKNGDELISHCVVSTYEYYEYKVLQERIGDKVRHIIPPTEANVVYENGKVANADAMSEEYINNPIIKQYVDNPNCTIILFENPPYADSSASDNVLDGDRTHKAKTNRKNTYIAEQYKRIASSYVREMRGSSRDLSNLFIWSGFHYYLRQSTDSYIVFSPVKYFKSVGVVNNLMIEGYIFNRQFFHATPSAISCVLWANKPSDVKSRTLKVFDIVDDSILELGSIEVKNVYKQITELIDKRVPYVVSEDGIYCGSNGYPLPLSYKKGRKPIYSLDVIGYLSVQGYQPKGVNVYLVRANFKTGMEQSFGFHLQKDNYLQKIVLFVSKMFPTENWYEQEVYFNSSDGGDIYAKDQQFLKACLIYTCLSNQNKCLSFDGSDGRRYQNELCFDDNALALADLKKYEADKETELDDDEKTLITLWKKILKRAKTTENYNPDFRYGVYQITKELNTFKEEGTGKSKKKVYDYPDLNGDLNSLRDLLKEYYKSHITEKMFKYELLK